MNVAYFCVFIASILPFLFAATAKLLGGFRLKDNHRPRAYLEKLEGKAFLAKSAHDNSWEAFAPFAAAVIISIQAGVEQTLVDRLAVSFIVLRVLYGLAYIFDKATLRTAIWFGGLICVVTLFFQAWSMG